MMVIVMENLKQEKGARDCGVVMRGIGVYTKVIGRGLKAVK